MDEQTKLLLGQFSHGLLGDERFAALQTMFGQQMAVDMLNTQPHESKKRESIHAAYQGFNEFMHVMQDFANYYVDHATQSTQAAEQETIED